MIDSNKIPAHVSIIMDGNGRWAKSRGLDRSAGHIEGVESVRHVLRAAGEAGVKYLSLYAFSEENWNRSEAEVGALMGLMAKCMSAELDLMQKENVRFVVLGNRKRLSDGLNAAIDSTMAATAANTGITLIVLLSYSGKWDITQAAERFAADAVSDPSLCGSLTPELFSGYLVTAGIPDPDLIIRTSGEKRISNYLLWQGAYSEFYFTDILWPDFRKAQLIEALEEYAKRDRRYGKTK